MWNLYFGNMSVAKKTVDHVLSYMRSSPTWAYNGGARSWGDDPHPVRAASQIVQRHSPDRPETCLARPAPKTAPIGPSGEKILAFLRVRTRSTAPRAAYAEFSRSRCGAPPHTCTTKSRGQCEYQGGKTRTLRWVRPSRPKAQPAAAGTWRHVDLGCVRRV